MPLAVLKRFYRLFFPLPPGFTEKDLPDLHGKVYVVTGANSGVGKELAHILYSNNAKVYAAARSKSKATEAIDELRGRSPKSTGELVFLHLDLADLVSVKAAAEEFLAQESRLDVLFNNAGVMAVPHSRTVQGYEMHLGTNNVGPFLFTRLLTPTLAATAKAEAEAGRPGAVRVVWVSSSATEGFAPSGGVEVDKLDYREEKTWMYKYGVSKAGNYLHATEYARRHRDHGIVSVALNPGNLRSELWRTVWSHFVSFLRAYFLFPPIYGAYTQLFAGLSPDVSLEKSGAWIAPWGVFSPLRKDVLAASKPKSEGGTGIGEQFWEWSEEQIKPYV